jgi:hypothetical protein
MALIEVNFGKPDVQGKARRLRAWAVPGSEKGGLPAGVPVAAVLISALTGTGG